MTSDSVPEWPRIEAVARLDGTGELTIDGISHPIQALTVEEARLTILTRIADTAAELRRPVRALASGPDGEWPLIVHPDGRVQADDSRPASPAPIAPPPSVFAPKTADTGETAAPEPPVTGAAEPDVEKPDVEKPDGAPWARAARLAQATAISTEPQEITDSTPFDQPTSLELPDEETVARAGGEVVDAAPFELPDEETVARAGGEVVDAAPFELPDEETVARARGEVVDAAPFELPDEETVARAHGQVADTMPAPAEPAVPRRRRIIRLTVVAAGAVVLVAAGTFAVVALTGNPPEPGPTASVAAPPGKGAKLLVQAPAGYGQTAVWSVPVGDEPQILLTPDGGVLAAPVEDDKITVLDQATGVVTWEGRDPVEGLHVSQVGEEPVLVADSPGTLHLWPLDTPDPAGVAPTTVELGSDQAEVTYDGTAPLIVLPDQTVGLLDGKSETPISRDVPEGASPVAATPQHVVAVGPDAWWTITADADPVRQSLPKPKQAVGDPTAAIPVGGNQLAVVWRTEDSAEDVLALVGLNRNAIRATSLIRSSAVPPDAEPLRDRAGSIRTIGPVLLDVGPKPVIADLGDIAPEAVVGRTVYGTSKSKPAVATWSPDGVKLKVTENPGETAQIAALTKDIAFVVASKDDETFLYALPRTEGNKP
ncbi:hypothetical protein C8K30_107163 [Promicromonospora sp. AC04]|uniref:hypothetical protein n=1 Tax=Promicromonospora sp. AC04 TaxID=2135723 RepID=UPI000D367EE3|nr:hypothetical protein [Promicromonospora sp. AC04]PUB25417.1 hypothetical protein C8K30_107163 [Promicromonospora sp. AC04]